MPTEAGTAGTALYPAVPSVDVCGESILQSQISGKTLPPPIVPPAPGCKPCWDSNVALLLVVLAGFLVLVLVYRVLLLRHRLRMARAGHALEYFGFYHMARYTLKDPSEARIMPDPCPPPAALPEAVPHVAPQLLPIPSHHPQCIIYTTPPSPVSDTTVYSRIGAPRPSRFSGVSHTQVVLFERSCL